MSRASKHLVSITVVACSALLAGCSSDSSGPSAASGGNKSASGGAGGGSLKVPNPCTLVDTAEFEPIVGVDIARNEHEADADAETCTWYGTASDTDIVLYLQVYPNSEDYDASKMLGARVVSGASVDTLLGLNGDVWVKMSNQLSFFVQCLAEVSDKTLSAEIKPLVTEELMFRQLRYEGGYRFAKLVAGKLK